MIRINLLRNRAQGGGAQQSTSTNISFAPTEETSDQKGALKNLLFLFIGLGLLVLYENYNKFSLNDSTLLLTNEYSQIEQELNKSKADLEQFKGSEEEAKVLEDKLSLIKKLSRVRLREVKALDYIQEVIPDKIWLRHITMDQESVKISGYSIVDEDISGFIQALDRSSFFQGVVLTQAAEVLGKNGSYKQFDIAAKLESIP